MEEYISSREASFLLLAQYGLRDRWKLFFKVATLKLIPIIAEMIGNSVVNRQKGKT
jgi:hypothetical protein